MSLLLVALSCSSSSPSSVFKLLAPHDVDVHTFEVTGRGLRTLRDRELGEALLEVPDSGVVLAERVLETDSRLAAAAEHAAELGSPLSDEGLLACFVAQAMSGDAQAAADVRMLRLMHDARCTMCCAPCTVRCVLRRRRPATTSARCPRRKTRRSPWERGSVRCCVPS